MYWIAAFPVVPYAALLTWICRKLFSIREFSPSGNSSVSVSVIIACRNEEQNLSSLLLSLEGQDYPRELFEIIVIDDNSTDRTAEIAGSFSGELPLKVLPNNGSGKKEAIKTGIRQSYGELILTTDADCTMGSAWISSLASFYEQNRPGMIIGPVRLNEKPGFFGRFQELEFLSLQGITAGTAAAGNPTICNGANLAFTRQAYLENESNLRFDIASGDDVFLLHSMKAKTTPIRWIETHDAMVFTSQSPDIPSFIRQRRRWASKAAAYRDAWSIAIGIVTLITILLQAALMVASLLDTAYLETFLIFFVVKSIPDFIVLHNTATRYKRKNLLYWFLPSQLIYPWYVIMVIMSTFKTNVERKAERGVHFI